jgi:hypothetical protein
MDFKSIISKLDSMETPPQTPAAPALEKAVQLNEDAQLRVLSGRTSYIEEAKKKAEADVKEEMKVGDKKPSATGGTIEKTATGVKHHAGKNYGGSKSETDSDEDDKPAKKKAKKESIDAEEFKGKFAKMVEAAKPDFLDMDKDGDKKEPMKKAVADKKKNPFAKKDEKTDEGIISGAAKLVGKGIGGIAKGAGAIAGVKDGVKKAFGKGKKASTDTISGDDEKNESKKMKKDKKMVKESVESKLSFKDMVRLVQESGGQQQIDAIDKELFNWANRVAVSKLGEGMKAELYAGLIYERNGGVFEMYDVLSETKK